jgi:hypothetical protein
MSKITKNTDAVYDFKKHSTKFEKKKYPSVDLQPQIKKPGVYGQTLLNFKLFVSKKIDNKMIFQMIP